MTVSTLTNSVVYRGNGATTQFAVPFKVLDEDHLVVTRRDYDTGVLDYTYVGTDYTYSGIGDAAGTLTLAGTALDDDYELVIERIVPYTQSLDIVNAGGFYPETVEDQLDLIMMGVQQVAALVGRGAVVPVGEDGLELSKALDRAGKFFAFDAAGRFVATSGTGADGALRTDLAAAGGPALIGNAFGGTLANGLVPSPKDFGVTGDGIADDTAELQAWITYCDTNNLDMICLPTLTCKTTDTLTFSGACNIDVERINISYAGTRDRPALKVLGTLRKTMRFGLVTAATIDWGDNDFAGISFVDAYGCEIHIANITRFTVGYELVGTASYGCAHNKVWPGTIRDCKYSEVLRTTTATGFVNENTFYSGNYGNTGDADLLGNAYGTWLTWDKATSARGHNNNRWVNPSYEMGTAAGATYRVPMWFDEAGAFNTVIGARQESNKGPFAICDGGLDTGTVQVYGNNLNATYNISGADQQEYILQVNGAYGNLYTGPGCGEHRWLSPDIGPLVTSNGGANVAYIGGPLFFMDSTNGVAIRTLSTATQVATARNAVHLLSAGVFTAVDTCVIKTIRASLGAVAGSEGQIAICAHNAAGVRLTGNATDATWGNEPYVKGPLIVANASYGGCYTPAAEDITSDITFTVREEVKMVYVGWIYGGTALAAQSIALVGYSTPETPSDTVASTGMRVFAAVDDDGTQKFATAKPDTAGTHGYYAKGVIIANEAAAAGQVAGWQCSVAGWLAAAWAISTAYAILGTIRMNDTGKIYELITAGTSAGAGGPTGTGADITDGTCHWKYIGLKAVFIALGVTA